METFFVPKGKPPQVLNKTTLSDLQKRADAEQAIRIEQQRLKAQWKEWQQKMQQDYERVLAFEKQAVGNELKAESWQRFLKNWKEDNPYSQQDTELRSGAQAKLSYWRNVQKVEPKSNPGIEVMLSGKAARAKLLKKRRCEGCDLTKVYLQERLLQGAWLNRANLTGANLSGTALYRADLRDTNLTGANLSGASLGDAKLDGANLSCANLSGADLWGTHLHKANYTGAKFCNTTMPDGSINNSDC